MLNIDQLPESYITSMRSQLTDGYEDFMKALSGSGVSGVRINTLKTAPDEVFDKIKVPHDRVPWTENGFYVDETSSFTKHPFYYAGMYYIQEPSAMSPVSMLGVRPSDKVLDLCAAPGGKSTQIACMLGPEGSIYSNDLSASRCKALLKNIELFGVGTPVITCADSRDLTGIYQEFFDRILVDAPCSGEGMFRRDQAVLKAYRQNGPEFFAPIQKSVLRSAAQMLKPGGTMVYSTCTFSVKEDEDNIREFLEEHPEFTLDPIEPEYGFYESKILPGCVKLFPHLLKGEGHFIARLRKSGSLSGDDDTLSYPGYGRGKVKLPADFVDFLGHISVDFRQERFYINGDYIYYLPRGCRLDRSVHYIRSGLLMGRLKNGRFEPSQALAMFLSAETWKNALDLGLEDDRVIRYLKGETIDADDEADGYRLVCADGHALGWVKQSGSRCKNKYYPGWRFT